MQIEAYDWLVDREKGRPCLVAGTAPTALDFPYDRFSGVYITCGDGPLRFRDIFRPDYWVSANNEFPVPEEHLEIINSFKRTVFIFSDSVAYSRRSMDLAFLRDNLKVDWLAYDQRHFGGMPCADRSLKCCELLRQYPGRTTIQEFLQARFSMPGHYSPGSTTALHALAVAILLGCNPIYMQGIELPRKAADYKHKVDRVADGVELKALMRRVLKVAGTPGRWLPAGRKALEIGASRIDSLRGRPHKSAFYDDMPQILADFRYLSDLANRNGIRLCTLSRTSTLNEVRGINFTDPSEI